MPATQTLATLPRPPVLRMVLQTAWSECRASAVGLFVIQVVNGLTPAAQVALTARLLTAVLHAAHGGGQGFAGTLPPAAGLIVVTVLRSTLFHVSGTIQRRLGLDLRHAMDGRTLSVAARSPLALFDRADWHDLVQAAGTSAGAAAEQVLEQVFWLLQSATGVVGVGLLLATAAWWLPLGLFAGVVPTALWELWQGDRHRRHTLDQAQDQRLLAYLGSLLSGGAGEGETAELRLFGLAGHLLQRWRTLFGRLGSARARFEAVQATSEFPVQLLRGALLLGGLVVLGSAVVHGRISPGRFMALAGGLAAFNGAVAAAAACVRRIRIRSNALADFGRLALAAGAPPPDSPASAGGWPAADAVRPGAQPTTRRAPPDPNPALPLPAGPPERMAGSAGTPFPRPLQRGITFEHVCFAYAGSGQPALRDVELTVRAGECLALVGPNGAGKSTLVKLLLGLYRPDGGRILADGEDLARVEPDARRAAVVPVFQDHLRLQFTAAEAIGFGSLRAFLETDADRGRVRKAARAAGADGFLEDLPLGYETPLGRTLDERGVDLSGGQWQRLAIARALYADPEVLVLDEPAAALDPQAEVALYTRFRGIAASQRTTILVTHRLGAARIADRIAVLHAGRIAEAGSHAELLAAGGLYARMWATQAAWYR